MALMNALPLLAEIKQALEDLVKKGEPYAIYSNKLPTTLEDRYFLQEVLGKGEWFMYEKVPHTKAVAFNAEVPGVWIEVFFSERDPNEPILEVVAVDFTPPTFTFPVEDLKEGIKKFEEDLRRFETRLTPFAFEVAELYRKTPEGKSFTPEDPKGVENLVYHLLAEGELVLENKRSGQKIVSTVYPGIWVEYDREEKPVRLHLGAFPPAARPSPERVKEAPRILEERKQRFLPKYEKRVDLPLL
ncbi:MAG: hydrogenase expression/formation protein [Aquificae bacterium]|nr:hydrogenase expression/formation protein [Aquificota bacterium]